MALNSAGDSTL